MTKKRVFSLPRMCTLALLYSAGRHVVAYQSTSRFPSSTILVRPFLARWQQQQQQQASKRLGEQTRRSMVSKESSTSEDSSHSQRKRPSKKIKLNNNVQAQEASDKLAAAFESLAIKEGFTSKDAYFADDATFEDDFVLDDDDDEVLAEKDDDGEDDYLDFGGDDEEESMEDRIAAAQRDSIRGEVSSSHLDDVGIEDMRRLGFKKEINPFEGDETPRVEEFKLVGDAMTCPACGSDFQCQNEHRPGYLPPAKYDIQVKLSKIEEMQTLQEKADSDEWSVDDEIAWLLQTSGGAGDEDGPSQQESLSRQEIDIQALAEDLGLDVDQVMNQGTKAICKRCHGLQNFGKVEEALRPGWTDEPLMSQEKFRELLRPIAEKPAVIIAIVDLFDFSGSVLPELDAIAGENPVLLAANKMDLLPSTMGQVRAENWVRRELEYMGVQSIGQKVGGGAVRLVSCKTGLGIPPLLAKARSIAEEMDCDVYIVGAANAGKSTLLNFILRGQEQKLNKDKGHDQVKRKIRAGNANSIKGAVTTSPLPGTTLKFIKVDLDGGRALYDTPGLLIPGTLTQMLTPEELKIVVPNKKVEPITFRVGSGKSVLVGGLAEITVVGDSKPFLFTFFVANQIKLHCTDASKTQEFIRKHAGGMLTPPLAPGLERMEQIGEFVTHTITIEGRGWKEAAADLTLTGLGWIAVTGAGSVQVEVKVPKGIGVQLRPPLMPFDIWEVAAKYTGSRAVRKSSKSKTGKRRKGVGRN